MLTIEPFPDENAARAAYLRSVVPPWPFKPGDEPETWTGHIQIVPTTNYELVDRLIREDSSYREQHHGCLSPHTLVLTAGPKHATIVVGCKKCPPCKLHRARSYMARGIKEGEESPRVWFLTCTLPPHFFWARPKDQWMAATLKEGQDAIKRFRERIRPSGRKFRFFLTVEVHTGKRVPGGKPTDQTGHFHLHIMIYEIPGMRLTKDEIELAWCRWPKFRPIPSRARVALHEAEQSGFKLGHVECHLVRTIDPRDERHSNAFGRPVKEGVGYSLKYLFKQAHGEESPDTPHGQWETPLPVRTSLFFGKGWQTAFGLEERSRVCARIERRTTNETAGGTAPSGAGGTAGGGSAHCQMGNKLQGLTPWSDPHTCKLWVEEAMRATRERYATQTRPKLMAAIRAMTSAQPSGP